MITSLQTLAAGLDMDAVTYQVTGMIVVFACLVFLSLILTISGSVAVRLEASRKAKEDAAKAALAATAPTPAPIPVAAVPEPTPAEVAALAAGIYDAAASSITPQVVAAIAAAVKVTVGKEARILDIKPVDGSYGQNGRISIMNSHFPTRR
ncbi:MAG: OadG family protein [Akkermansia sp.]|nr:OadG family protein [Akkermansia sp.]